MSLRNRSMKRGSQRGFIQKEWFLVLLRRCSLRGGWSRGRFWAFLYKNADLFYHGKAIKIKK